MGGCGMGAGSVCARGCVCVCVCRSGDEKKIVEGRNNHQTTRYLEVCSCGKSSLQMHILCCIRVHEELQVQTTAAKLCDVVTPLPQTVV